MNDPSTSELAAVYGRVSTDKQKDSLNLQEKNAVKYVGDKGFSVACVELDEDESGGIPFLDRPAARRVLDLMRRNPSVKHLVVGNIDRLGRDSLDNGIAYRAIQKRGVALHILDFFGREIRSDNEMDQFCFQLFSSVAQLERAMIRKRIQKRVSENFENARRPMVMILRNTASALIKSLVK